MAIWGRVGIVHDNQLPPNGNTVANMLICTQADLKIVAEQACNRLDLQQKH